MEKSEKGVGEDVQHPEVVVIQAAHDAAREWLANRINSFKNVRKENDRLNKEINFKIKALEKGLEHLERG